MMKAGFWLNLAGILVIVALSRLFITPLLGNVDEHGPDESGRWRRPRRSVNEP